VETNGANVVAFRLHSNMERAAVCKESVRYLTTLSVAVMRSISDAVVNSGTILAEETSPSPSLSTTNPTRKCGLKQYLLPNFSSSVLFVQKYYYKIRPFLTNDCVSRLRHRVNTSYVTSPLYSGHVHAILSRFFRYRFSSIGLKTSGREPRKI